MSRRVRLLLLIAVVSTASAYADEVKPIQAPAPAPAGDADVDISGSFRQIDQAHDKGQEDLRRIQELQTKHDVTSQQELANRQQDFGQQTQIIKTAGDTHPDNQKINVRAGDAMLGLGQPQQSLPLLSRAIDVATQKGDRAVLGHALFSRAAANAALRDYPAVVRDAKKVLDIDPNNQQAQTLISLYQGRAASTGGGDIQTQMQPSDGAQGGGRSSRQGGQPGFGPYGSLAPPDMQTGSQIEAARLIKLATDKAFLDPKGARSLLDQALAADPKNVAGLIARARVETKEKDFGSALSDADAAAKLSPRAAEAFYLRAQAKQGLGYAATDVAADYAMARELDPTLTGGELAALASGGAGASGPGSTSSLAADAARAQSRHLQDGPARLPPSKRPDPVSRRVRVGDLARPVRRRILVHLLCLAPQTLK